MRDGDVVRPVAKEINIDKSTLFQYVKKQLWEDQTYWLLGQPQSFSGEESLMWISPGIVSYVFWINTHCCEEACYQLAWKNDNYAVQLVRAVHHRTGLVPGFCPSHREISLRTPDPLIFEPGFQIQQAQFPWVSIC